jgi:LysM repeat protein
MNKTNPFIPQGSLLEQKNKKRARVKWAVLAILGVNILLISPVLLFQACKRSDQSASTDTTPTADTAADVSTSAPPSLSATTNDMTASNTVATAPAPAMAPAPVPAPAPVAPPVAAPAPSASTYVVVPHDTLGSIARKFNVKLKDLEAANPDVVPTKLAVGKTLNIPASSGSSMATTGAADGSEDVYTVKTGDNLTKIAHGNGTTVKELMALNNLKTTMIKVGDKLKLPAKSTAAAAPVETTMPATTTTASNPTSGAPVMR